MAYQYKRYQLATELLPKEIENETNENIKADKAFLCAESFKAQNNSSQAEIWYLKADEFGYDTEALWKAALSKKQNEKYEEAIVLFKKYEKRKPDNDDLAKNQVMACQNAIEWKSLKNGVAVFNLEKLNSPNADFAPFILAGQNLIFTSSRNEAKGETIYEWTGDKHFDLFTIPLNNNGSVTGNVTPFDDKINTEFNEGTISYTADGKKMFYSQCGSYNVGNDYCKIYMREQLDDNTWSPSFEVKLFEIDTFNVTQPFVSPNGRTLYFISDIDDGAGQYDIYASEYSPEGWSQPRNLGGSINTEGNEMFPYIDNDGVLYFSSDGHNGMGGLDIFKAINKGKKYEIENLKYPLNSGSDDFGIAWLKLNEQDKKDSILQKGYFSSTRIGGKGNDDIYYFEKRILPPPPKVPLTYELIVSVYEKKYSDPNNPNSIVTDSLPFKDATMLLIKNMDTIQSLQSKVNGSIYSSLDSISDYTLTFANEGYFTQNINISTKGKQSLAKQNKVSIYVKIVLEKIFKNKEIVLDDIYYDYDKTNIRADAIEPLNKLLKLLQDNPNIKIQLSSHTDCRGGEAYNQKLSQGRAQSVVDYLISQKIDASRLVAKGYGESKPEITCTDCEKCSEEDHQKNRRTTFKVL